MNVLDSARCLLLASLFSAAVPGVTAQQKPASSVATSPSQAPTTISVDARLVNLPVVVRDKKGALIQNLTKDDFTLQVDGKPQTIRYFDKGHQPASQPGPAGRHQSLAEQGHRRRAHGQQRLSGSDAHHAQGQGLHRPVLPPDRAAAGSDLLPSAATGRAKGDRNPHLLRQLQHHLLRYGQRRSPPRRHHAL